jgi:peptide/nickel transport system permease protein
MVKMHYSIKNYYAKNIRRFFKHKFGLIGFIVLCIIILLSLFSQFIAPYDPTMVDVKNIRQGPSSEHWFGTDELGRDNLSRIIYGTRITLFVMVSSISVSLIVGTILGLFAGYVGGVIDAIIMRIVDAILCFPILILALSIVAFLGPGIRNTMIAVAVANTPKFVRVVRGQVLSIKESEYINAARAVGCSRVRILFKEILPNSLDAVLVYASLQASMAIITESSLSFLGLGVQPPTPSWGWMVAVGMKFWNSGWWMSFFPGLAIFITVLSINFMGDALRDVFDPKLRI